MTISTPPAIIQTGRLTHLSRRSAPPPPPSSPQCFTVAQCLITTRLPPSGLSPLCLQCRSQDAGRMMQDAGRRTRDTGHETQDTRHRTQDAGTQDTGHRTQDAGRRNTEGSFRLPSLQWAPGSASVGQIRSKPASTTVPVSAFSLSL